MSGFIDQFAGHMFDGQRKHQCPRSGVFDLMFNIGSIIRELVAQLPGNLIDLLTVFNEFDMTEQDHTADIQRPLAFLPDPLS